MFVRPRCSTIGKPTIWSRADEPELLAPIMDDTSALWEAIKATADCFLHGDCHTDNILIDDNELVWTDWQGTRAGNSSVELALPLDPSHARRCSSSTSGDDSPICNDPGLDQTELSRAFLAAQLSISLFVWPEYARYTTEFGIDRVHQRVQYLARRWLRSQRLRPSAPPLFLA